jgi:hypothetical protein
MQRQLMAALAVGGMLAATAALHPANAVPSPQSQAAPGGVVELVRRGGGGGPRGGMGPGIGARSFGGPRGIGPGRGAFRHGPRGPRGGIGAGPWRGGRHGHHHHRPRFRFYAPYYGYVPYYYDYGDGDDCSWLRRRAVATGSRYWWRRYYACIED